MFFGEGKMRQLNDIIVRRSQDFDLFDHSILLGYVGSISHGTYKPQHIDDIDMMGIVILPKEYIYGLKQFGSRGTREIKEGPFDLVFYDLQKYIMLASKNNPNVMCMLWLEPDLYVNVTELGRVLIEQRELFSSKLAYHSFCGYAFSQLKKMEKNAYKGYMGKKRKELTDKIGYDSKNASHLIRLLKMGIEFLETGQVNVRRKVASLLMDIKAGNWRLEKVKKLADSLFKGLEIAKDKSKLPDRPDYKRINMLLCDMYSTFYFNGGE